MSKKISSDDVLKQSGGTVVSLMGSETVMLCIENGKYYNLGEIGGVLWNYLEQPITISSLCKKLGDEYEVEHSQCEEQVLSFLNDLYKEGLVERSK
ncbi:lasso peptide biosynthesis PqqD family chaperone [Robertmurraya korlensis]|uniref:lasso peptide biosynthesis PqqD family chaperone n=1 Tax=Robertmurraya korlensis TaxID=519977 RepID=UPI0008270275|nr:lasso peptide biosynthesis PqqD family chaperone [Robertmurraya korlensis]